MSGVRPSLPRIDDYTAFLGEAWVQHLKLPAPDAPTVISTFAGMGGSSLGYSMAGYRELLAVEWDEHAAETFRLNFPNVPVVVDDIANLSVSDALRIAGLQPGELDVLDGSPPCQGFSMTNLRRSLNDDRNRLFLEFARLLRGLKPKAFVMENVPGMVQGRFRLIFAEIVRTLKASGYRVSVRMLNAAYFGVPQSRKRLIFVGVRDDLDVEPSHPQAQYAPVSASLAIAGVKPFAHGVAVSKLGRLLWDATKPGQSGKVYRKDHYFNFQKLHPNKPSPTLTRTGKGSVGHFHWNERRLLTIGELRRISSVPDAFVMKGAYAKQCALLGNIVPPLLMRAIARHVRTDILSATIGGSDA